MRALSVRGVRGLASLGNLSTRHRPRGDPMPLSEHEERILAEIERQLAAEDPRFVARARKRRARSSRTLRLRLGVALAVLGFLSLLGLASHIAFGAVGMALIFIGIVLGASAVRERADDTEVHVPPDERT